jgi:hypothetical protein
MIYCPDRFLAVLFGNDGTVPVFLTDGFLHRGFEYRF